MSNNEATVHACTYPSTYEPELQLSAEFNVPAKPGPLVLLFHGWHMRAETFRSVAKPLVQRGYFVVNVDMRGRGASGGKPDASGMELVDGLDALTYAAKTWPESIDNSRGPYVFGASGGGGNTLSLIGKAPDQFAAAVSWAGMTDYALWFADDQAGAYRDEMTEWIGESPDQCPEAYRSRSGITVLENIVTPTLLMHGRNDKSVQFHHAENYRKRAEELGKEQIEFLFNDGGHGDMPPDRPYQFLEEHNTPVSIETEGEMLFCGFLYTNSFRLIADSPSVIGMISYKTGEEGQLEHMAFSRAGNTEPLNEILIDIPIRRSIDGFHVEASGKTVSIDWFRESVQYRLAGQDSDWEIKAH